MKLRIITIVLVLAIVCTLPLTAQKQGVLTSKHDIGYTVPGTGSGCKGCHAPHNGSVADQNTGTILLWSRAFSAQAFGTYTSPTMNSPTTTISGGSVTSSQVRIYSLLCMSCHDGVTSPSIIAADSVSAVGNPTNSAGLANDHPVNMKYDEIADPGLAGKTAVKTAGLTLYGPSGSETVQCASCHNAHNTSNTDFLRISNTNSALCTTCHP